MRVRGGAVRTLVGLWWCAGALVVAACSSDDGAAPAPATTTTTPAVSTGSSPTASPTEEVPAFDCPSVDTAQDQLDTAFADELSRLDIGRGDPRAQSVYALVTTTQGPEYYAAVLAAAPPELAADAQLVLDYYQRLADRVGTVETGEGSTEDLTAAMTELDDATAAIDDPEAGTAVVDAQERLQTAVQRSCTGASATETTTGTGTTTESPTTQSPGTDGTDGDSAG